MRLLTVRWLTTSTVNEAEPQPEQKPVIAENVVDEPIDELGLAEKIGTSIALLK